MARRAHHRLIGRRDGAKEPSCAHRIDARRKVRRNRCRLRVVMNQKQCRSFGCAYGVDGSLTEVPPPTDIAILDRRVHPDDPKARDIERLDLAHQLQTVLPGTGECPLVAVGEFVVAGKQRGRQR